MKIAYRNILIWLIVATFIMLATSAYLVEFNVFRLKARSYDFMVKNTVAHKIPSDDIVLVVVDDKSLSDLGRWPWKRTLFAEIFEYLNDHTNAQAIAFDALISSSNLEDLKDDKKFFQEVKYFDKLYVGVAFSGEEFHLTPGLKKEYEDLLFTKTDINFIDKRTREYKNKQGYLSFTQFPMDYLKNAKHFGAVNIVASNDDYVREIQQAINFGGRLYPSLELGLYSRYTGIKDFVVDDNYIRGENADYKLKIPIKNDGRELFNNIYYYRTKDSVYSHKKISASDAIKSLRLIKQGKEPILDSKIFDGKIVFVGANANAQYAEDKVRTPVSDVFAGIDVRATNLNNMLKNQFYTESHSLYNILGSLLLFLLVFIFICVLPTPAALMLTLTTILLYFIFAGFMYNNYVAVDIALPMVYVLIAIIVGYSYRFLLETMKKEKLHKAMGKYISKDVMQNVVKNIDTIGLGGKRANVTVLFADIRGFTTISEKLSAEEVTNILNEYFSAIVPIIDKNNGILNKFVGDAVLAVFGEPIENKNHAIDAVKCADQMLKKVKTLQTKWLDEGKPKIDIGIGISTGEAFVGNIGAEDRFEYTVIGDTVNTASRIENYNKIYKTKFLISQSTFEIVQKHVDVIKIREVTIRGKAKKINIYEVLRIIDY